MARKQLCISLFCIILLIPITARAKSDIEFLLDLSGSMRKAPAGETQIDSARKALLDTLAEIPADTQVAVRVYGHRIEQAKKAESCKDTELIVPFGAVNVESIKAKIAALNPKGYTPIAYSLEQSKADFSPEREADKVVILLSDGEETCGGDPVAVLKKLKEAGFEVIVHTVGFNVDAKTRQQLEAIAQAGGGHYFDAQGAAALSGALKAAAQESLVIEKAKKTYGNEVRGGDSYETAVALQYDIEYKLDHHQKISYFDYFYVDLEPGRELNIELKTLEKGVNLRGETPRETGGPYAGLQLHDSQRNKISYVNIIGSAHTTKMLTYTPSSTDRYYVLIGSTYDDMNKDHVTFKLKLVARGDLDGNQDAGDSLANAMPITPKRYQKNFIGSGDVKDVFHFEAKKRDSFFVGIIPSEDTGSYFRMAIYDSYKQKVMSQNSGINEGLRSKEFSIPEDGRYYLQIGLGTNVKKPIPYILELKKTSEPEDSKAKKPASRKKPAKKASPSPQPGPSQTAPAPLEGPASLARPSVTKPPEKPSPPKP